MLLLETISSNYSAESALYVITLSPKAGCRLLCLPWHVTMVLGDTVKISLMPVRVLVSKY